MPPVIAAVGPIARALGGAVPPAWRCYRCRVRANRDRRHQGAPSGGAPKPSPYPTAQQVGAQKNQLASVVQQNLGNLQEAGGGGSVLATSPSSLAAAPATSTTSMSYMDLIAQFMGAAGAGGGGGGSSNFSQLSIPTQGTASLSGGPGLADSNIFGGS